MRLGKLDNVFLCGRADDITLDLGMLWSQLAVVVFRVREITCHFHAVLQKRLDILHVALEGQVLEDNYSLLLLIVPQDSNLLAARKAREDLFHVEPLHTALLHSFGKGALMRPPPTKCKKRLLHFMQGTNANGNKNTQTL